MFNKISLTNRIALFYSFTFSILLLVIFLCIYWVVDLGGKQTMYKVLDEEIESHTQFVASQQKFARYVAEREWEEVEHTDIALNPVFIAVYDAQFQLVENSPNLVQNKLEWNSHQFEKVPYYRTYQTNQLLISQAKLIHQGKVVGYIVIGVSTKHNEYALHYLSIALLILFPLAVLFIFVSARSIAYRSIQPVFTIIKTAQSITENNLSQRITLPDNKDELHQLSTTINSLLDRLEFQIVRAKQFSADASHELRTPLSILKGTLELMIRKDRSIEEYKSKITYTLQQVDRLYHLIEQFLLLSRVENNSINLSKSTFEIKDVIHSSLLRFKPLIDEKKIKLITQDLVALELHNYVEYIEVIIDNMLSNAIKYVRVEGEITVHTSIESSNYVIEIQDNGIGMNEEDLKFVKNRYFRIKDEQTLTISGYGLGLNIAAKLAQLANSTIDIQSEQGKGTKVILKIKR